jgi:diacylglycerol kinase family enzyme
VPISILPLGTANNIARALGLNISIRKIIRGLATARRIKMDVGIARGPWGDKPFLEAVGAGLFARMMARRESHEENGVRDQVDTNGGMRGGVQLLQQVLGSHRGHEFSVKLDRSELSGKYLLIEAMNIPSIGPALELAPRARHGDGFLDVVIVSEKERPHLHRHLSAKLSRKSGPRFAVHRTRTLQLSCNVSDVHFDDQTWPDDLVEPSGKIKSRVRRINIEVTVFPGALRVLVPG